MKQRARHCARYCLKLFSFQTTTDTATKACISKTRMRRMLERLATLEKEVHRQRPRTTGIVHVHEKPGSGMRDPSSHRSVTERCMRKFDLWQIVNSQRNASHHPRFGQTLALYSNPSDPVHSRNLDFSFMGISQEN